MSFNPQKFIDVADTLKCNSKESEEFYRTLINRAYYGAFGCLRNKIGIRDSSPSIHRDVIAHLIHSPNNEQVKIGKKLESLFKKRKEADYNYNLEIKKCECDFVIADARKIISDFNKTDP